MKILVVEDDRLLQKLYRKVLDNAGYEVITADDGLIALELIQAQIPKLVILDVQMPRLDGVSVIEQLKHNGTLEQTKVMILTANNVNVYEHIREDVDVFLQKPVSSGTLITMVQRLTGTSELSPSKVSVADQSQTVFSTSENSPMSL